jgi:hypothetical protein
MATQRSKTRIINKALVHLGSSTKITHIDDHSPAAYAAKAVWAEAMELLLSDHPWNFAITRKSISADMDPVTLLPVDPVGNWSRQYSMPGDCLRWLPWSVVDTEYFNGEIEMTAEKGPERLLTHEEGPIVLRYIFLQDNVSRWSPAFVEAMALKLAVEMCEAITSEKGLMDRLEGRFEAKLLKAKRIDGQASGQRDRGNTRVLSRINRARHGTGAAGSSRTVRYS